MDYGLDMSLMLLINLWYSKILLEYPHLVNTLALTQTHTQTNRQTCFQAKAGLTEEGLNT